MKRLKCRMCGKVFLEDDIHDSVANSRAFPRCESPEAGKKPFVDSGIGGHLLRELEDDEAAQQPTGNELITPLVKEYLQIVARHHVCWENVDTERDAVWERLTKEERDFANEVVAAVFEDYL